MESYVGRRLGNFEVGQIIGKGGMAAVYRGLQPSMNREVAIKIMFPQLGGDEALVKRFRNEAKVIAQLQHAHILPVIEYGEEGEALYIVMRYLDTGSLKDRISREGMDLREAHRLFVQIASALQYAHSKGVVHRDLKPANILVDEQGNTFLTDFGIAKMLEGDEQLTGTGGVVGTPSYMSPEQGMGTVIDHRSDIYSLGVLLFEMLTGKLPFAGGNPMAVMLMHMNDKPPRPSSLKAGLHPELDGVILRALSKKPDERFQSANQMIEALDRAVAVATGTSAGSLRSVGASARVAASAVAPQSATVLAGATPAQAAATLMVEPVTIAPTVLTSWVQARGTSLGLWLRALALSLSTFVILQRLLPGNPLQTGLLSLVPGILLYGLLRAPTLGAVTAHLLILLPLLVKVPGLGLIWALIFILSAARLHAHEMLLSLVTLSLAGVPFVGLVTPLIAPWWLRARRSALPLAIGVGLAILFGATLGWPTAGGLLPAPEIGESSRGLIAVAERLTFLDLFEPGLWPSVQQMGNSLVAALLTIRVALVDQRSLSLIVMATWALAAVLSVSNRRVQSAWLRAAGILMGALLLLVVHLAVGLRAGADTLTSLFSVVDAALLTYILTQWPLQVDPNAGNLPATVQRLLRQAIGALFVGMGLVAAARATPDTPFFNAMALVAVLSVLWTIVNPQAGGLLAFLTLLVMTSSAQATLNPFSLRVAGENLGASLVILGLLVAFIVLNLAFDRRRPLRWNPIGMGALVGAPVVGAFGLMAIPSLGMGLLEAQVPAAAFAVAAHVALWLRGDFPAGAGVVIQLVGALIAVLLPQRLMDTTLLRRLHNKARRLIFAVLTMLVVFPVLYFAGGVTPAAQITFLPLYVFNLIVAVMLVLAMGDAAATWVSTADRDADREEEVPDPDTAS